MTTPDEKYTPVSGAWIAGLTLLFVGGLLLAQQLGVAVSGSAWGCLLLIPGVVTAAACYRRYRATGANKEVASEAILAFFFMALAVVIISGYNIDLLWPILLIGLAISFIIRSVVGRT